MAQEDYKELEKVVDELSVLVRRLAHRLKKIDNNSELSAQAMDYLARNNLTGSLLSRQKEYTGSDEQIEEMIRTEGAERMNKFKFYRKKNLQMMRAYEPGEDLSGISVNKEDTPELGGMIAINPDNPHDQWYVAKKFFEDNYEKAEEKE